MTNNQYYISSYKEILLEIDIENVTVDQDFTCYKNTLSKDEYFRGLIDCELDKRWILHQKDFNLEEGTVEKGCITMDETFLSKYGLNEIEGLKNKEIIIFSHTTGETSKDEVYEVLLSLTSIDQLDQLWEELNKKKTIQSDLKSQVDDLMKGFPGVRYQVVNEIKFDEGKTTNSNTIADKLIDYEYSINTNINTHEEINQIQNDQSKVNDNEIE